MRGLKLRELGEGGILKEVIDLIVKKWGRREDVFGLGDDAAGIKFGDQWLLLKIDGSSVTASKYPWLSWSDLSYRIGLNAVTDLIAKGAKPLLLVSSIGVSPEATGDELLDLIEGLIELSSRLGAPYVGGDVNSSAEGWVDVALIGVASKPIPSRNLGEGDIIYVMPCLGGSAIEYLTYSGRVPEELSRSIIDSRRKPEPPIDFLGLTDGVKAAFDISDGLRSVRTVIEGKFDLILEEELPLCPEVSELISHTGVSTEEVLRYLGEEFAIVYTLTEGFKGVNPGLRLGVLKRGSGRVFYRGREIEGGWDNFRGFEIF